jgi:hypothetical protein
MTTHSSHRPVTAGLLALSAALLAATAGCSTSKPAAREQIASGQTSVEAAIGATTAASDLSVPEMATAREKLAQAQAAQRAGDWEKARRLAEQADLDAQVARAKIAADKSQKAAAEIDASLATLREELNRQSIGASPAPVKP